jgi:predicted small lipoprotein YifL
MRRRPIPTAISLLLVAGCDTPGPLDPPPAAPVSISATTQNESTPPSRSPDSPAEVAEGGILIGSGT